MDISTRQLRWQLKQQSKLQAEEVHASESSFALWLVQREIDSAAWLPKSGGSGPKLLVVTQPQGSEDVQWLQVVVGWSVVGGQRSLDEQVGRRNRFLVKIDMSGTGSRRADSQDLFSCRR